MFDIVLLLSEEEHTDHNTTTDKAAYFKRIVDYPKDEVRIPAMKIKVADRYDNLLGVSYTNFEGKKKQYLDEVEKNIYASLLERLIINRC